MEIITETIKVLLVEDHDLVRAGIRSLLAGMPDVHVVAEAGDGEKSHEHQFHKSRLHIHAVSSSAS